MIDTTSYPTPYSILISPVDEYSHALVVDGEVVSIECHRENLLDLFWNLISDPEEAVRRRESASILNRIVESRDHKSGSHFVCEMGSHRVVENNTYCYGFQNVRCCPECFLRHLIRFYGTECPSARNLKYLNPEMYEQVMNSMVDEQVILSPRGGTEP